MGINPNKFPIVWQAIRWWMRAKDISSAKLSLLTGYLNVKGYTEYRIENGIRNGNEWITSDFLHACVDIFGLRSSRQRGTEETDEVLTDEECIEMLTAPLRTAGRPRQGQLWD